MTAAGARHDSDSANPMPSAAKDSVALSAMTEAQMNGAANREAATVTYPRLPTSDSLSARMPPPTPARTRCSSLQLTVFSSKKLTASQDARLVGVWLVAASQGEVREEVCRSTWARKHGVMMEGGGQAVQHCHSRLQWEEVSTRARESCPSLSAVEVGSCCCLGCASRHLAPVLQRSMHSADAALHTQHPTARTPAAPQCQRHRP